MDSFICLLISMVSLPLLTSLLSFAASVIQIKATAHLEWLLASHFLGGGHYIPLARGAACFCDRAEAPGDASELRVVLCESDEAAECVFCLSGIEEGEEIRELRCRHVFHRHCLDGWLERGRSRCPLCRDALAPRDAAAKCWEADDEELDETFLNYYAYVNSAWWIW